MSVETEMETHRSPPIPLMNGCFVGSAGVAYGKRFAPPIAISGRGSIHVRSVSCIFYRGAFACPARRGTTYTPCLPHMAPLVSDDNVKSSRQAEPDAAYKRIWEWDCSKIQVGENGE